jgi:hypothetical protein
MVRAGESDSRKLQATMGPARLALAFALLLLAAAACSGESNDTSGTGGARAVTGGSSGGAGDRNGSGGGSAGEGRGGAAGGAGSVGPGGAGGARNQDAAADDAFTAGAEDRREETRPGAEAGDASVSRESGPPSADGGTTDAASNSGDGAIAYNPCPTTANTPCAVLPLGDSITEGFASSGAGYRVELFRQAVMNGKSMTFVGSLMNGPDMVDIRLFPKRHEGHDGFTIDSGPGHSGISGMITDQAMSTYRPHIVLLMIGTNDINGNFDIANAPTRLGALIDEITADGPSALVVVASIVPIVNDNTNQRVQAYNAAIPGLVSSRARSGKHVMFVDNYAEIARNPNYRTALMADNLHPNDMGYAVLGRTFYGAISALLPSGP